MKIPLGQWILGFFVVGILIFWVFNEFGKKAQKNYINGEVKRIKDELQRQVSNPTSRLNEDETIALTQELKGVKNIRI